MNKLTKLLSLAVLAAVIVVGVATGQTVKIAPGEAKNVWVQISDRDSADFTISTVVYWTQYTAGTVAFPASPATQTDATISGQRFYGWIPTTTTQGNLADWSTGSQFDVYFQWQILESPKEIFRSIVRMSVENSPL